MRRLALPDRLRFASALAAHQRQLRTLVCGSAISVAAVTASMICVLLSLSRIPVLTVRVASLALLMVLMVLLGMWLWRRCTPQRVASLVESRSKGLDNLIVTAEEVLRTKNEVMHPIVGNALFQQAADRLQSIHPGSVQPLRNVLSLALLALATSGIVIVAVPQPSVAGLGTATDLRGPAPDRVEAGDIRVVVTPPTYTGRAQTASINPLVIEAIEGSHIRVEAARNTHQVQLVEAGRNSAGFVFDRDRWVYEFRADRSRVLLIQLSGLAGGEGIDRLLQLRVDPDRRPLVRIRVPAKDLIFGAPRGQVPIEIEARDDLALAALALRYTRVAGSGETFTFEEGTVPVQVQQASDSEWRGHATLALDAMKLEEGDTLVYRATATDRKPGADPSASEAFLIEIGRLAGAASTGFAIPEERDRQAISQQMVIIKTERLHGQRASFGREAFEEQSRLLAVEQRMVKAEFVFMTGGEVADEVEEAAHAHELAEGRFENAAQVELLAAIREMSRAEARLNAADTAQALTFERAALRALQRAFDRRRYLLRTLPERTRIDLARRLSGDRSTAQPPTRHLPEPPLDPAIASARQAMRELSVAIVQLSGLNAGLASRVVEVDPTSDVLQKAAIALASAGGTGARVAAARTAQLQLAAFIRARLPAGPRVGIADDPLVGRFADDAARGRGKP